MAARGTRRFCRLVAVRRLSRPLFSTATLVLVLQVERNLAGAQGRKNSLVALDGHVHVVAKLAEPGLAGLTSVGRGCASTGTCQPVSGPAAACGGRGGSRFARRAAGRSRCAAPHGQTCSSVPTISAWPARVGVLSSAAVRKTVCTGGV
jgi:hypothetical protein